MGFLGSSHPKLQQGGEDTWDKNGGKGSSLLSSPISLSTEDKLGFCIVVHVGEGMSEGENEWKKESRQQSNWKELRHWDNGNLGSNPPSSHCDLGQLVQHLWAFPCDLLEQLMIKNLKHEPETMTPL